MKKGILSLGAAVAALCLLAGAAHAQEPADPTVVVTDQGPMAGVIGNGVREFRGIPYALPPTGDRRWAPPQPAKGWTGTLDATRYASACPQLERYGIPERSENEDCLYLNVTAPAPGGKPADGKKPVFVWIHGGGFVGGSSGLYDLSALAKAGDMVVVTMNYRLGVFGFMPHRAFDADFNGGYAFEDQREALRWVQRNIAAFGGDPDNVTLAGESAGGASACMQILAPDRSAGLFHKAILQSAGCVHKLRSKEEAADAVGKRVAELVGCVGGDELKCLREKPVKELLEAGSTALAADLMAFAPVHGSKALPLPGDEALATGKFLKVPLLHGGNTDELRLYVAYEMAGGKLTTRFTLKDRLADIYGKDRVETILKEYPVPGDLASASYFGGVRSDFDPTVGLNNCVYVRTAQLAAKHVTVHQYEFADPNAPDVVANPGMQMGAVHSAELPYQFPGFSNTMARDTPALTEVQRKVAAPMMAYWTSFARTGTPSGADLPAWPVFDPKKNNALRFGTGGALDFIDVNAAHKCDFWKKQYPDRLDKTY
ncbi:carboxylesterase/lipase family protein [Azospirillum sp.]|uniref:carboxylesterase/lipase family protein n=1 Tax=Azospirillum sp. TaxID=34012 RepID=UPI002D30E4B5|nr:carboxylesterase family protein [Azospirillum sp.]HYD65707.1 carboxylesterase family protein [Azospirillum sp.]